MSIGFSNQLVPGTNWGDVQKKFQKLVPGINWDGVQEQFQKSVSTEKWFKNVQKYHFWHEILKMFHRADNTYRNFSSYFRRTVMIWVAVQIIIIIFIFTSRKFSSLGANFMVGMQAVGVMNPWLVSKFSLYAQLVPFWEWVSKIGVKIQLVPGTKMGGGGCLG